MPALHHYQDRDLTDADTPAEAPLLPSEILAHALGAVEGRLAYTAEDMATAALCLVDLRHIGWDVRPGQSGSRVTVQRAALIAVLLGLTGSKDPSPCQRSEAEQRAERLIGELGTLGYDLWQTGGEA